MVDDCPHALRAKATWFDLSIQLNLKHKPAVNAKQYGRLKAPKAWWGDDLLSVDESGRRSGCLIRSDCMLVNYRFLVAIG
jgi:hypothetical protein